MSNKYEKTEEEKEKGRKKKELTTIQLIISAILRILQPFFRAQLSLNSSGYDIGTMGNGLSAKTVAAIYNFQKDKGMIPSGKLTNEVLSALGISAV